MNDFKLKIVILIVIPSLFLNITKSDDNKNSCENLKTFKIHPLDCCIYPKFIDDLEDVTYKCTSLCKVLPSPPFHCLRNCKITESGVIRRGNFNGTNVINLFFEGGNYDPTALSDKWMKIVEKSAENCENEVPIKTDIKDDNYNYFYTKFVECVRMLNFINCPDFKNISKCQEMMDSMEKCDDSNYLMLHEFLFEDFYYKNNSMNVTLKWTTRTTTTRSTVVTTSTTLATSTSKKVVTTLGSSAYTTLAMNSTTLGKNLTTLGTSTTVNNKTAQTGSLQITTVSTVLPSTVQAESLANTIPTTVKGTKASSSAAIEQQTTTDKMKSSFSGTKNIVTSNSSH